MTERRPGQWPVDEPADLSSAEAAADELYVRRAQEKALHEMVLDSIRHDLEQQPTGPSAQAKARIWCAHILAIADDVAAVKRRAA
ncbi:hypothetical protein PV729_26715 [Streptomyces europaeiscabiei]|uniref:Uncharacterized protein n=1 Tax=Streptomyces europaeiscabiei TaxID=146819 RepID=A0ABU4NRT1_9ACTN|nr:hypothetical protein [Streptomyces europaeiscabiei]MDX2771440.1 hypothetical protein [Streptomyces europaeiscabiei]MDX3555316.1 hypothetical protein [Streptomyces europaeiscabiei]MDX3705330.1 hypothetical protein [Streptomyces europaeiscabiei]